MAATFSVLLLTVAPPGQSEANGAFVKIDGRESLLRAVELFLNRDNIKQIQICFTPEALEESKRKYGGHLGFSGVKVIVGGPKWSDQLLAGVEKLSPEASHVIVHDAARPAVAYSDIDELMDQAAAHDAATLTAPLRASLLELDEGGAAMATHAPSQFVQQLMPQAFAKAKFVEIAKSKQEPHASLFTLAKGSPLNIRVGTSADAGLVKTMIQMLPKPKIKAASSPFEEAQW